MTTTAGQAATGRHGTRDDVTAAPQGGQHETLRRMLGQACEVLASYGHDDMNQGQVSARVPGEARFLIKGAMVSFRSATADDMVWAPLDQLARLDPQAPPETALHQAIYQARSDVNAIVHSHAESTLVFGALDEDLRPISHEGAWFAGAASRFTLTSNTILSFEVGDAVATALGDGRAVFLRNHGGVVTGESLREATVGALALERACRLQLAAISTGLPWHVSSSEDVAAKRSFIWSRSAMRSYWNSLVQDEAGRPRVTAGAGTAQAPAAQAPAAPASATRDRAS